MSANFPRKRDENTVATVDEVIRARRTEKILANDNFDWQPSKEDLSTGDRAVESALDVARWAPFHYPRDLQQQVEPWTVRWLRRDACLTFASKMPEWHGQLAAGHKFPKLFRACGSCVIVSWLPNTEMHPEKKRLQVNEEHLAATAAFVQNFLIALEARNLGSYWASGPVVLEGGIPDRLGLQDKEKVTAVVFVHYRGSTPDVGLDRLEGKLRKSRDPEMGWLKAVEFGE